MSCEYHGRLCAYAPDSPHRDDAAQCPICHCDFAAITAPATRTETRTGYAPAKKGQPRQLVEVIETFHLFGRGELPLQHLAGHVVALRAGITAAAALARKRRAS